MHSQLHLKSYVKSWFYFQQIFPLGNTGRCKITSIILWCIPFCIAFCVGRGIRQSVYLHESSMANQGWCGNHILDSFHSFLWPSAIYTFCIFWIRGSRTHTSRQIMNLLDECHGECIGYWLGEFEIHLFVRCKRQSKG